MKTKEKSKGISLIVLIITVIVTVILLVAVILSFKNSRADKQAKELTFKTNFKTLENELYTYISQKKLNDTSFDLKLNSDEDNLTDILPSAQKLEFEDLVMVCGGNLVFREDADFTDEEREWALEVGSIASSCEEYNSETSLGVSLSEDGGTFTIVPGKDKVRVGTKINVANDTYRIEYAFSNTNFSEPYYFYDISSGDTVAEYLSGGTYYIWVKVYDSDGNYLGRYISSPYIVRYSVVYDANGGSGAPDTGYKNYLSVMMISLTKPSKSGYEFVGWSTAANSNNVEYLPGGTYSVDRSVKLYAIYKTNSTSMLVITEDDNNSSTIYGEKNETVTISVIPTKASYVFSNWQFSGSGSFNSANSTYTFGTGVGNLKAIWVEASAMITDDETYYASLDDAILACGTSRGKEIKLLKNIELKTTTNVSSGQNIKINLNGNTLSSSISDVLVKNNGTLEIYGGSVSSSGTTIENNGNLTITSGSYSSKDGICILNASGDLTIGKNDSTIDTSYPKISGKTTGVKGNLSFYDGVISGQVSIDGNATSKPNNYKVKLELIGTVEYATLTNNYTLSLGATTGGTVSGTSGIISYGDSCKVNATALNGYKFSGWYEGDSIVSSSSTYTFSMPAKDLTLTAKFEPRSYFLTLDSSAGGTVSGSSGTVTYNTSCSITATESSGYEFLGWYEGDTKVSSDNVYTFNMPAYDYTLTAKFQTKQYTFTRSAQGPGTISGTSSGILEYGTSISVTATAISGYSFQGWYSSDGTKLSSSATYTLTMPSRDLIIYARFQCNTCDLVKLTSSVSGADWNVLDNTFKASSSAGVEGIIYIPANGVGLVFKISSSAMRATLSYSSTLDGDYAELTSLGGSASNLTYTSTISTGYLKINIIAGGELSIYMADGATACAINDKVTGYIKQQTTPVSYTTYTDSKIAGNYSATPSFTPTGGCYTTIYLPVKGYKFTYSNSAPLVIRYSSSLPDLNKVSSISITSTLSSSSTTYTTTAAGYFICGNSASTAVTITPPNGGYMKLQLDLPKIDVTNKSGATFSENHLSLETIGACYFKSQTGTVYINAYKVPSATCTAAIYKSSTTTFPSTAMATFTATSWTSYSVGLTPDYYYQIGGYGEYYFFDGYGSACTLY